MKLKVKIRIFKSTFFILFIVLTTLTATGCNLVPKNSNKPEVINNGMNVKFSAPNNNNSNEILDRYKIINNSNYNGRIYNNNIIPGNSKSDTDSTGNQLKINSMRLNSMDINTQIKNMAGIENASTIVTGNTCLVAYIPSKSAKSRSTMENMIKNQVKQLNPTITKVVTTESLNIMDEVAEIINTLNINESMDQIKFEVNQLIKRTMLEE